jgi:hypothetical protein
MTNNKYNGWANRETWLVNLWFGDRENDLDDIQCHIEELVENLGASFLQDAIDIGCIDWRELRQHREDEKAEEEEE